MYNHKKAQQSKNRVHISWDILWYNCLVTWKHHITGRLLIVSSDDQHIPLTKKPVSRKACLWRDAAMNKYVNILT